MNTSMNTTYSVTTRQSAAALTLAVTMTFGLLWSMGALADRYTANELYAQSQAASAVAQAAVPAHRAKQS